MAKVPKFIGWLPVTEIKEYCFYRDETIQEVMIPDTVKKIGENDFSRCTNLQKVKLPSSLRVIQMGTFGYSPLAELEIPAGELNPEILFQRIDKKVIEIESEKLKAVLEGNG